jgi:hypothetical protein
MKRQEKELPASRGMEFDDALKRYIENDPGEIAGAIAGGILRQREDANRHIERVKKELQDGARPRKGRFRL